MKIITKRNVKLTYLQAIAIIMVVDSHVGLPLNLLNNVIPYNAFYMPLFVFISGYLFKKRSIKL